MNNEGVFEGLTDPKLNYLAKRVANAGKLAAYRAVARAGDAGTKAPAPKSIEGIALSRFKAQPAIKQRRGIEKAKAFMALPAAARIRRFGDVGGVDMKSTKPLDEVVLAMPIPTALRPDAAHFKRVSANPALFIDGFQRPDVIDGFSPQLAYDNLRLRIRKVKCNDETDGFLGSE
jgi:hypothetical protein